MDNEQIIRTFQEHCQKRSEACAAMETLIVFIDKSQAGTMVELRTQWKSTMDLLAKQNGPTASILSGCELLFHCITLTALDHPQFSDTKKVMVERGKKFLHKLQGCRQKIAESACDFITSGKTILTHSRSRTVLTVLKHAAKSDREFKVYVTESLPDRSGAEMHNELQAAGINSILIHDCTVGYIMEKIDMVLVGAEGVVETGGILNKIGTYAIAIAANVEHVPFYVVAECFKFCRVFPLNQQDIPNNLKFSSEDIESQRDLSTLNPRVDYTPPSYITLLFTDVGKLTPAAVSDKLIEMYL